MFLKHDKFKENTQLSWKFIKICDIKSNKDQNAASVA